MSDLPIHQLVMQVMAVFLLATVTEPLAHRLRIPHAALLILAGFISSEIATKGLGVDLGLDWQDFRGLIIFVFLPTVVFAAASRRDLAEWQADWRLIVLLGLPLATLGGVVIGAGVYYGIGHPGGFPLVAAAIVASILMATDPGPVCTMLERFPGISKRLPAVLDGESQINDALAVSLFGVALAAAGGSLVNPSLSNVMWEISRVVLGGVGAGLGGALAIWLLLKVVDNGVAAAVASFAVVYLSFAVAEAVFTASGVITGIVLGLFCGHFWRQRQAWQPDFQRFWDSLAYMAEGLIFVVAGATITWQMFTDQWLAMSVAVAAAALARLLIVVLAAWLPLSGPRGRQNAERGWHNHAVMMGGGLHGAVALALVMSLPLSLDYWYTVQSMVYAVVLFTLLVQAPALSLLLRFRHQ